MIINDPAQTPEHAILTVNAICTDTFHVTIICVRFTCSRFCTRLSSALSSSTSSRIGSCALDWNQYFTILIIQSLCRHACSILHRTGHDLAHSFQIIQTTQSRSSTDRLHPHFGNSLPRTETASLVVCVDDHIRLVLVKLLVPLCRWLPDLKHCVPFFSTCCTSTCCFVKLRLLSALLFFVHGFSGPGPWLFCFTGSRVPSLAVSLSSRPFFSCFIQPTIHTLGLKTSCVHNHCKRRRCGHRISNLLNTLNVKGLQNVYDVHSAFGSTSCTSSHGSSTSILEHSCARVSHALEFAVYSLSLAFSEFVRTGALPVSEFQTAVSTSSGDLLQNRGNYGCRHTLQEHTHAAPHKMGTTISLAEPGYPLLCRCTESVAPQQCIRARARSRPPSPTAHTHLFVEKRGLKGRRRR